MTPRQKELMLYLQKGHNRMSSYRELSQAIRDDKGKPLSVRFIRDILDSLQMRGYIRRIPHVPRSIEILKRVK